jgi:death-on-curing protein
MAVRDYPKALLQAEGYFTKFEFTKTSWGMWTLQKSEHSTGAPVGYGAKLAVRKYGDAIDKLAE